MKLGKKIGLAIVMALTAAPGILAAEWRAFNKGELTPWNCDYRVLSFNRFAGGNVVSPIVNDDFILYESSGRSKKTSVRFGEDGAAAQKMRHFVAASQQAGFDELFSSGYETSCSLTLTSDKLPSPKRFPNAALEFELTCSFSNGDAAGQAAFEVDPQKVAIQTSC